AHMALGWVTSEGLAVDDEGRVHDLTIRSFGILRAVDMPPVEVALDRAASGPPVNGSDAVFAAVAAAAWLAQGAPPAWPTGVRLPAPPYGPAGGAAAAPSRRAAGYRRAVVHACEARRSLHARRPRRGVARGVRPGRHRRRPARAGRHGGRDPPGARQPRGPAG